MIMPFSKRKFFLGGSQFPTRKPSFWIFFLRKKRRDTTKIWCKICIWPHLKAATAYFGHPEKFDPPRYKVTPFVALRLLEYSWAPLTSLVAQFVYKVPPPRDPEVLREGPFMVQQGGETESGTTSLVQDFFAEECWLRPRGVPLTTLPYLQSPLECQIQISFTAVSFAWEGAEIFARFNLLAPPTVRGGAPGITPWRWHGCKISIPHIPLARRCMII